MIKCFIKTNTVKRAGSAVNNIPYIAISNSVKKNNNSIIFDECLCFCVSSFAVSVNYSVIFIT